MCYIVKFSATALLWLIVLLGVGNVRADEKIIRKLDYSDPDSAKKAQWVDDGGWMGSVTRFDEAKDPETGDNAYTFTFQGRSQVYHVLPALTEDKVYKIDVELKAEGQIESGRFYFRNIRSPWVGWGGGSTGEISLERTVFSTQLRMKEDAQKGQVALFFSGSGSGSLHIYSLKITELNNFMETQTIASAGELFKNTTFDCMDAGWVLGGNSEWSPGKICGPGSITYYDPFSLQVGVPYVIEIDGDEDLVFNYRIGMGSDAVRGNGVIKNEKYVGEFKIEQPYYGSRVSSLSRHLHVGLGVREDGEKRAITKVSIYTGEKKNELECGFRFSERIIADEHIVTFGEVVEFEFGTKGIPENSEAVIEVLDHRDRKLVEIPVVVEKQNDGLAGGSVSVKIDYTGWMYFRMKHAGEVVDGFPGELVIVGPDPSNGKNSDFILGSHLSYNEPGTTGHPLRDADLALRQARQIGITGERMHTRHIRWWFVEDEETGGFNYSDWKQDLPLSHGVIPLGMLDGTARRASSAPDNILAQEKNQWPRGWGAYPAKNIEDWEDYVTRMVTHFKGRIEYWEIWNEPDHIFLQINPEYDKSRASAYMRLLKSAYTAAKKADPDCKIVAGSVTAGGRKFLLDCIEDGMLDYCDVVSFHGYGRINQAPRAGVAAYDNILNPLREAMREKGKIKPIWDTESGYGILSGIKGADSSENAIKAILAKRAAGIGRFYLYSGYTRGYPGHAGHRMHVGYAGRPLVIQGLLAAYDRLLGNADFVGNPGNGSEGIHVYEFKNRITGQKVLAGWYSGDKNEKSFIQSSAEEGEVFNVAGNRHGTFSDGKLELDSEVKYFVSNP